MELLAHVELALAPEYVSQGEIDKSLRSLLAGLLKTLLRECVGQPSYSLRKIIIEMIWHWFQDKQREILDFALDRQYPGARYSRPSTAAANKEIVAEKSKGETEISEEEWARIDAEQTKKAASKEENHDPTNVAHKLSLFKQRNLAASENQRQALLNQINEHNTSSEVVSLSPPAGSAVKVVYTKSALDKQRLLQQHIETHNGPSGPEVLIHQNSVAPFFNKRPTSAFAKMSGGERGIALTAQPADLSIVRAEARILSHLTRRLEQEQHQKERASMLSMLAHNQARLDEESARRVESQAVSAQAGRACHFILTNEADPVRYVRSTDINNSLSPYDFEVVDERIPQLMGELAGGQSTRIGSVQPPTHGAADDGLDVMLADDCQITPLTIRLDLPFREQMIAAPSTAVAKGATIPPSNPSTIPIISRERLSQLRMADRVRNAFAESGAKGVHCPYKAAFKSVVRPTDSTFEECLSLLPHPGDNFPSNPFQAANTKRKPKSASVKRK